jgi:hypothetical protein
MAEDLIKSSETALRVDLTRTELETVYVALKTLYDELGHDASDVQEIVESVLAKLPSEAEIGAVDLDLGR